jgi:sulfate transport system ATP-binding protein
MKISVRNVTKSFGSFRALDDVSLEVPDGELVALLGPSGSGKTTLLRIIAGLELPERGHVLFDDDDAARRKPGERRVGFVFQHYALFRHMSVFENVAFGLRVRPRAERPTENAIQRRVHDLLGMVQLSGFADRFPSQLSGGQRQRVALARALAVEPRVLLLDEPFGALDAKVRAELRQWLRRLHDEIGVTSVFVTHDQEEALDVADRVVVMDHGRIEQVGTPEEVFHSPANEFVLGFLGQVNQFEVRALRGEPVFAPRPYPDLGANTPQARIFARPHQVGLAKSQPNGPAFPAKVLRVHAAGPIVRVELSSEFGEIRADITHERMQQLQLVEGVRVWVGLLEYRVYLPHEEAASADGSAAS